MHNNQKYNHFISTFHLGRKDNLYKHFKYYKKLFPDMFNYAPTTYILPVDGPDFEIDYKKRFFDKSDDTQSNTSLCITH